MINNDNETLSTLGNQILVSEHYSPVKDIQGLWIMPDFRTGLNKVAEEPGTSFEY